jgi:hypothetical protein
VYSLRLTISHGSVSRPISSLSISGCRMRPAPNLSHDAGHAIAIRWPCSSLRSASTPSCCGPSTRRDLLSFCADWRRPRALRRRRGQAPQPNNPRPHARSRGIPHQRCCGNVTWGRVKRAYGSRSTDISIDGGTRLPLPSGDALWRGMPCTA